MEGSPIYYSKENILKAKPSFFGKTRNVRGFGKAKRKGDERTRFETIESPPFPSSFSFFLGACFMQMGESEEKKRFSPFPPLFSFL